MAGEQWRDIKGYHGHYQVSSRGRVKSVERYIWMGAGWRIVRPRILTQGGRRYRLVVLSREGKTKTFKVHRLVAAAFIPNPMNCPQVNHMDGNKRNNEAINLEWVTHLENEEHARVSGLKASGERHGNAVLCRNDVKSIRRMLAKGQSVRQLALQYGVAWGTVQHIRDGLTWAV